MKNVVWKAALWLCWLACTPLAWAATPLATVTIADGEAVLIRGAMRYQLAEGVRLAKDDIVETSAKGRLLRIEFSDGLILDLGPESRAILAPKLAGDRARLAPRAAACCAAWSSSACRRRCPPPPPASPRPPST